jgi:hypothetical protein
MNWSDLKEAVAKIAPVAGLVLGGPASAANMVGGLIANFMGVESTPEAVKSALMEPGKAAELAQFEMTHKQKLAEIALETTRVELADLQHARTVHKDSIVPAILSFALLGICSALLFCIIFVEVPKSSETILIQSFGTFLGFLGASLAYWHGTSRSSQNKDKLLAKQ